MHVSVRQNKFLSPRTNMVQAVPLLTMSISKAASPKLKVYSGKTRFCFALLSNRKIKWEKTID